MKNLLDLLDEYIELISDDSLKQDVYALLHSELVINSFANPSSMSGKFHPQDECQPWGLLIHSLRVCNVAIQLYRCVEDYSNNTRNYDILIASALLHDVPYKVVNGVTTKSHAHDNALWFSQNSSLTDFELRQSIISAILHHMGRWQPENHSDYKIFPNNVISWTIHQADCLASRSNIATDINTVEYLKSNLT